jgi:hypothetical protein
MFERDHFFKLSAKVMPERLICHDISARDLYPFQLPTIEELARVGVTGIHLGDFLFWDEERQTEFVRDVYGWRETEIEGTYKRYKSAECIMPGVHDFTKFLKRGFGRATDHASADVRAGLLTREEGFALAAAHDPVRPKVLDYYLQITGMTEEQFMETMKEHRHEKIRHLPIYGSGAKPDEK